MRRIALSAALVAAVVPVLAQPPKEGKAVKKRTEKPDPAVRCVLEGVPWIGFYRGGDPEDDPFPACVRAFLEYRGDDVGFRQRTGKAVPWHELHEYVKATAGASFRLGWDGKAWDWGAMELLGMPGDPLVTFRNGLESVGYSCEVLLRKDFAQSLGLKQEVDYDEAAFREGIISSLHRGVPVLALGAVGPPECCLITGYDGGGKVLVGRSFFQNEKEDNAVVEFEEAGGGLTDPYFRKQNWFAETRGIILIGEKIKRPSDREIHVKALRRALEIMRTPVVRGHWTGQAAFTMWADTLLKDAPYPQDDLAVMKKRHEYHHGAGGTLAEARAYGADFLHQVAHVEPAAADELHEAARCFHDEHDLVWAVWEFTGGMVPNDEGDRKFANAFTRGRTVPLIRLARRRDAEAAAHIQKALELMGDKTTTETPGNFGSAILAGVPKIGYGVHVCPFPGSLHSVMEYLGDPVEYDYLMGVTGAAFRRIWNRDDGGNTAVEYLAPEPFRRASEGIGYELREVPRDKEKMLAAIRESIARGRPVIGFGIVGPPEAGIVTGYSKHGEVLHGWSYHQGTEWPGYYEQADWFARLGGGEAPDAGLGPVGTEPLGMLAVDDKNRWPGPSKRDLLISSLKWAIDLARTAKRSNLPNHISGLAAYDAWAKALEVDADYPKDDAKVMDTRHTVQTDQAVMTEERGNAARFLRMMTDAAPEAAEHLRAAAHLYEQVGQGAGPVYPWGKDWARPDLADPAVRREIAQHIRAAAEKETKAVEQLEAALKVLTGVAERKQ